MEEKRETIDQEDQRLKPKPFKEAVPGVMGKGKATGDDKESSEESERETVAQEDQRLKPAIFKEAVPKGVKI
jgi:hypothetical protein